MMLVVRSTCFLAYPVDADNLLNVGCTPSPEYSSAWAGALISPAMPSNEPAQTLPMKTQLLGGVCLNRIGKPDSSRCLCAYVVKLFLSFTKKVTVLKDVVSFTR